MWTWVNSHWWQILVAWSAVNAGIIGPLSVQFPPVTWYGKLLHVLGGFSPMDVLKAFKAMGTEAIPPTAVLLLVLSTQACSSSPAPASAVIPTTARQVAVDALGAEELTCTAYAGSKQQGELCIYQVHAYWCGHGLPEACIDGGTWQ